MIRLLTRLVRNRDDLSNPVVRRAFGTLASVVGILLNLLLFAIKLVAGTLSGSISIRADAVNNLSDALSSVIGLISFKIAAKPADRDHPFGHARIEYIASMIVSFLILFIGVELVRSSFEKLLSPVGIVFSWLTVAILTVSILLKLWLALFNRSIGRRIDSKVMCATAVDCLSDAGATTAVLLATLSSLVLPAHISRYTDPVMGLLVAVLIFVAGLRVLNDTKNSILGEAPAKETVDTIRRVVASYPDALGIHDLAVHSYGPGRTLASLHVEVDGSRDVFETHDTIDRIERELRFTHGIECTIHLDPILTDDPHLTEWRDRVRSMAAAIDPRIDIHDFRMVPGTTHTNLIFDLAVPFEIKIPDSALKAQLAEAIGREAPNYFAVITVDRV
ncbi:MAG: cation transporter [Clostridia bacterium]|nr:cation transporter [Clostridia bacterium]